MVNMKLVFDGRTVLLGETPESLGMEDGDMVEVGNFACNRATIGQKWGRVGKGLGLVEKKSQAKRDLGIKAPLGESS